ncbi:TadE family type IV pilus minor pilin [Pseudonocardia xishanensis]|uniref:TadE family type IV pilus minor pilin n=1 Tax=Pseudonocardia xishanensis TaxID=630995 RepID=A0ABP8RPH5_9PSEU
MRDTERGAITVEAAIALSALTLVVLAALGSLGAVAAAVRCQDAARELARLAARGDVERAHAVATTAAPPGAEWQLSTTGDEIRVTVSAAPLPLLPLRISGSALALREPGAGTAEEPPP